jgi:hypothetical protein
MKLENIITRVNIFGCSWTRLLFQLLHGLVDGLCKRGHLHYQDYDKMWTLEEWWALNEAWEGLIKAAVRESLNKDQVNQVRDHSTQTR